MSVLQERCCVLIACSLSSISLGLHITFSGFYLIVSHFDRFSKLLVYPTAPLYLPSTAADLVHQRRSTWLAVAALPLPLGYRWSNPPSPKLPPEVSAIVTFVSGQAGWAPARSALWSGHLHPVYDFKPNGDFGDIGCSHQISQKYPLPSVTRCTVLPLSFQP
jgi:hypothetical protein